MKKASRKEYMTTQVSRENPGASLLLNVSHRGVKFLNLLKYLKHIAAWLRIFTNTNTHCVVVSFLYFILINVQGVF